MRCPNKNDEEWKSLVDRVGEFEAYLMYIDNDYNIPSETKDFDSELYDNVDKSLTDQLIKANEIREKIMENLSLKFQLMPKKGDAEQENFKEEIADQLELLKGEEMRKGFIHFISHASKTIKSFNKKINSGNVDLKELHNLRHYASAYDVMEELGDYVRKYSGEGGNTEFLDSIEKVESELRRLKKDYLDNSEELVIEKLSKRSNVVKTHFKETKRAEYVKRNPKKKEESYDEFNERIKIHIDNLVELNKKTIETKEKEHVRNALLLAPKDLGGIEAYIVDGRQMDDHLIQLTVQELDVADFRVKEAFVKDRKVFYDKFNKIASKIEGNQVGSKNLEKFYGDVIERDSKGNITGNLTQRIHSSYYESLDKMFNERKLIEKKKDKDKFIKDWMKENLIDPDLDKGYSLESNIKPKWKNKQYDSITGARKEMLNLFEEMMDLSDSEMGYRAKLNRNGIRKMPIITKGFLEDTESNGFFKAVKNSLKDSLVLREDDTQEFGDGLDRNLIFGNEDGSPIDRISIPFRGEIKDKSNLSMDLFNSFMTNHFVSLNYKEKSLIKHDLLVVRDILNERSKFKENVNGKGLKQKIADALGVGIEEEREIVKGTKGSNRLKVYESLLEDRLRGVSSVQGPIVKMFGSEVSVSKAADTLMKISANNFLAFNYLGATSNALQGKVINLITAHGGNHFKRSNLRRAESKYFGDFGDITKDLNSYLKNSKTNLLMEKFMDSSGNFSMYSNNLYNNKGFRRALGESWANGMNEGAEHWIQSTLMYAMLDNMRMKNKNGKYVNKEGKVVEKRDQAMTLDEAYKVVDGELVYDDNLVIEGRDNNIDQIDIEQSVSSKIKDVTADLHGNYDNRNKAMIQRYWYGKLAMFMRKWIVRTSLNRFLGVSNSLKDYEDLTIDDKKFSVAKDEFSEGTYVSFIRFVSSQYKRGQMLQLQLMLQDFESLTDMERANIRSTILEMLIMSSAMVASAILGSLGEDEKDEDKKAFIYHLAYLSERLKGELQFYMPPLNLNEALRVVKTPSSSFSTLSLINDVTLQLFSPTEVYEKGKNRGDNKLGTMINKLVNPLYKNAWNASAQEKFNYLKNAK